MTKCIWLRYLLIYKSIYLYIYTYIHYTLLSQITNSGTSFQDSSSLQRVRCAKNGRFQLFGVQRVEHQLQVMSPGSRLTAYDQVTPRVTLGPPAGQRRCKEIWFVASCYGRSSP